MDHPLTNPLFYEPGIHNLVVLLIKSLPAVHILPPRVHKTDSNYRPSIQEKVAFSARYDTHERSENSTPRS
jgi:hypothetical protein